MSNYSFYKVRLWKYKSVLHYIPSCLSQEAGLMLYSTPRAGDNAWFDWEIIATPEIHSEGKSQLIENHLFMNYFLEAKRL